MFNISGKSAIITGAARGIGKAITTVLAQNGAKVVVADIDLECAKEVAKKLVGLGQKAIAVKVDVSKKTDVDYMVNKAIEEFGRLDIMVSNAGIGNRAMIHEMKEDQWDSVLDVNLKGVFLCTQAAAVVMREQKYGRIINISSRSAKGGSKGHCNYASAKAGVIALTKSAAKELGSFNVCVNAILPGFIKTDLTDRLSTEVKKQFTDLIVVNKIGMPEDIAYSVLFLASDEADYITGSTLEVTGGMGMFAG
jgi:3-oxoacyl-[acyl-carrier protein] reductase